MKRGIFHSVYLNLDCNDMEREYRFFLELGFEPMECPMPQTKCLNDGTLRLLISPRGFLPTGIVIAGESMETMQSAIRAMGCNLQMEDGNPFPTITGPSGTTLSLLEVPEKKVPALKGSPISLGGTFFEISVETRNHEDTVAFWEKLGFEIIYGDKDGNWVTMADDFIKIGFYRKETVPHPFNSPALTYFEKDMKARIGLLKQLSFPIAHELGTCKTGPSDAILESPGGHHVFMFTA